MADENDNNGKIIHNVPFGKKSESKSESASDHYDDPIQELLDWIRQVKQANVEGRLSAVETQLDAIKSKSTENGNKLDYMMKELGIKPFAPDPKT